MRRRRMGTTFVVSGSKVSSTVFFGRHRRRPVLVSGRAPVAGRSCELSYARHGASRSGLYSAYWYVRRLRREIYLTTQLLFEI
jgi:hypothetical protein